MHRPAVPTIVFLVLAVASAGAAGASDEEAIRLRVARSYVEGVYVQHDAELIRQGFHEDFVTFVDGEDGLVRLGREEWIARIAADAADEGAEPPAVGHRFLLLDVTGDTALVKIALDRDGRLASTDYLSLHRFDDDWQIVARTSYPQPPETEVEEVDLSGHPEVGARVRLRTKKPSGVPLHSAIGGSDDFVRLPDGTEARVIELSNDAKWLRLELDDASQGWVSKKYLETEGSRPPTTPEACSTPNLQDSHVLAISWEPAFCEIKPDKTECQTLHGDRFDGSHFALHGLWPNRDGCGQSYGYCGSVRKQPGKDFCKYPVMGLSDPVRDELGAVMPSAVHGTCLERHEWWKHGTCRDDEPDEYYRLALALVDQVNRSTFVTDFVQPNIGRSVSAAAFDEAFDEAFGDGAHGHVEKVCNRGPDHEQQLQELQLLLPRDLDEQSVIAELLARGPAAGSQDCPSSFEIDAAPP